MKKTIIKYLIVFNIAFIGAALAEETSKPIIVLETEQPIKISDVTVRQDTYPKITLVLSFIALIITVYIFHRQMKIQHRDKLIQQKQQSQQTLAFLFVLTNGSVKAA